MAVTLFEAVSIREGDPAIDPVHAAFFGGVPQLERESRFPRIGAPQPPLRLTKNIYNLADVFVARGCLVVTRRLASELAQRATVEFQPVFLEHTFKYPYVPGDFRFLEEDFEDSTTAEAIVAHFAHKFACPAPIAEYVEVVPHRLTPDEEAQGARVSVRQDRNLGIRYHKVVCINSDVVRKMGLYWDWAFVCSDQVFEWLEPHIVEPYFWVKRVPTDL